QCLQHLHGQQYSWVSSIFYFGYFFWEYPTSVLIARLPPAKYLTANTFVWGAVVALTAACSSYGGLLAVRFLLGVAEATITPAFMFLTSTWYTRDEIPVRTGIWFSGNSVGGLLASLLAYGIGHIDSPLRPWMWMYIILGSATFLWGVCPVGAAAGQHRARALPDAGRAPVRGRPGRHRRHWPHREHGVAVGPDERMPAGPQDVASLRHRHPDADPQRRDAELQQPGDQVLWFHVAAVDAHQHPLERDQHGHHRRNGLDGRPLPPAELHPDRGRGAMRRGRELADLCARPRLQGRAAAGVFPAVAGTQRDPAGHVAGAGELPGRNQEDDHDGADVHCVLRGQHCGTAVLHRGRGAALQHRLPRDSGLLCADCCACAVAASLSPGGE
ncbi:Pantothenate transporter, partial [Rasamsonia emersonii CBS 393.64]